MKRFALATLFALLASSASAQQYDSTGRLLVNGKPWVLGQQLMAASMPVVLASNQSTLNVSCVSGCSAGASFSDNSAFTGGSTSGGPMFGLYDTTPPAVTDGNAGIVRMNSSRVLMVDGSNFTQPVSGTVSTTGTYWPTAAASPASHRLSDGAAFYDAAKTGQLPAALDGSGFLKVHEQGTANVSVTNASLAVTGTFWQATQPVSGTFWQATQPVSFAAHSATGSPITASVVFGGLDVGGTLRGLSGTPTGGLNSLNVTLRDPGGFDMEFAADGGTYSAGNHGIFVLGYDGATQYRVLRTNTSGVLRVDPIGTTTQPVSGTVTANAGTGTFAVSGPLTDTQLRASAVPVSGTVTANQGGAPWSENITQIASTAILSGSGDVGAGALRVRESGTPTITTGQVSCGATATLIAAARAGRRGISVTSLGTTDVYVGASGVTTGTGDLLLGVKGSTASYDLSGALYCIVAAGSQSVEVY